MSRILIDQGQSRLEAEATRERLQQLGLPSNLEKSSPAGQKALRKLVADGARGVEALSEVAPVDALHFEGASRLRKRSWLGTRGAPSRASTELAKSLTMVANGLVGTLRSASARLGTGLDRETLEKVSRRFDHFEVQLLEALPEEFGVGSAARFAGAKPEAVAQLVQALKEVLREIGTYAAAASSARLGIVSGAPKGAPPDVASLQQARLAFQSLSRNSDLLVRVKRLARSWSEPAEINKSAPARAVATLLEAPEVDALHSFLLGPLVEAMRVEVGDRLRDPDLPPSEMVPHLGPMGGHRQMSLFLTAQGYRASDGSKPTGPILGAAALHAGGWDRRSLEGCTKSLADDLFGFTNLGDTVATLSNRQAQRAAKVEGLPGRYRAVEQSSVFREALQARRLAPGAELLLAAYEVGSQPTHWSRFWSEVYDRLDHRPNFRELAEVYRGVGLYGMDRPWVRVVATHEGLKFLDQKNQPADLLQVHRAGITPELLLQRLAR